MELNLGKVFPQNYRSIIKLKVTSFSLNKWPKNTYWELVVYSYYKCKRNKFKILVLGFLQRVREG